LAALVEPPEQVYLAANGDDGAAGTVDAPLATLREAANRLPSGGTVIVRGGTYPRQSSVKANGTTAKPLVIRAAVGEHPIFDGAAVQATWTGVIALSSAAHVVFDGLEIRNCMASGCHGIFADGAVQDLTIRNCYIHHLDASGARFAGRTLRFEGNVFEDIALTNENNVAYPNGGWPTCMGTTPDNANPSTPWAEDVVIRQNTIRNCWGEGIGLWYGAHGIVEDNTIENAWNVGIYADNAFDLRIARNFVHMTRGGNGSQGTGILFGTEDYRGYGLAVVRTHDITVQNNVIVAGAGIGWWAMDTPESTYSGLQLLHNSIVATLSDSLIFPSVGSSVPAPSGCVAKNNALAGARSWLGDPGAFVLGGNAWLNTPRPSFAGATDVSLSIDVGTISAGSDAQAWAQSLGTGDGGTGVTDDFRCQTRDTALPTRGAFER
jgi:hypothetical protein